MGSALFSLTSRHRGVCFGFTRESNNANRRIKHPHIVNASHKKDETTKKVLRKNPSIYESPGKATPLPKPLNRPLKKPEVLAPAGGWNQLIAAAENGADAVYFGVSSFNARARAENFSPAELPEVMKYLHERGMKGYLVLNVLVFDDEIVDLVETAQKARAACVDAVIVQDLGVVELIKAAAPGLAIHGSTQMTVTSLEGLNYAASLGIDRVVVGRELSVSDIAEVSQGGAEVEAFVHGALCVSYSGQCFSSEAWGGRSANRGQCAQACRLPYGVIVDGELKDFAEQYVLSPQDLAAVDLMPELIQAGVVSLKIEGRLKGPEYVAMTTKVYRNAVDTAWSAIEGDKSIDRDELCSPDMWDNMRVTFARAQDDRYGGLTHGFLSGSQHQSLVRGRSPRHRGLFIGSVVKIDKNGIHINLNSDVKLGDGLVIDQGRPESEEVGGSVFELYQDGSKVTKAARGSVVLVRIGQVPIDSWKVSVGDLVWKNKDPALMSALKASYTSVSAAGRRRIPLKVHITCTIGEPLLIQVETTQGRKLIAATESCVQPASKKPVTQKDIEKAVGVHLGDQGSFVMESCQVTFGDGEGKAFISMKDVKQARREVMDQIMSEEDPMEFPNAAMVVQSIRDTIASKKSPHGLYTGPRLRVLCRTPEQVMAAIQVEWLEEIILDFLEVKGLAKSCERVRRAGKRVIVATPRIMKPDEKHLWLYYVKLGADALLVRGTGMIHHFMQLGGPGTLIEEGDNSPIPSLQGDFSLNATNVVTADLLLNSGLESLALTYDCNSEQICSILQSLGERSNQVEIICHTNLPIFHTEHCVFARFLSEGNSYLDCGRPCEKHTLHIRDPATSRDHLIEADMGCRNTVFEGSSQTAIDYMEVFSQYNVGIYRIELVDQPASIVKDILEGYRSILQDPHASPTEFSNWMQTIPDANGRCHGTTAGSFRVTQEQSKKHMKKTAASLRT